MIIVRNQVPGCDCGGNHYFTTKSVKRADGRFDTYWVCPACGAECKKTERNLYALD